MSFTHLHLLLNHFPVIGVIIAIGILFFSFFKKNSAVGKVELALF
jgi:hypothetical protein